MDAYYYSDVKCHLSRFAQVYASKNTRFSQNTIFMANANLCSQGHMLRTHCRNIHIKNRTFNLKAKILYFPIQSCSFYVP